MGKCGLLASVEGEILTEDTKEAELFNNYLLLSSLEEEGGGWRGGGN